MTGKHKQQKKGRHNYTFNYFIPPPESLDEGPQLNLHRHVRFNAKEGGRVSQSSSKFVAASSPTKKRKVHTSERASDSPDNFTNPEMGDDSLLGEIPFGDGNGIFGGLTFENGIPVVNDLTALDPAYRASLAERETDPDKITLPRVRSPAVGLSFFCFERADMFCRITLCLCGKKNMMYSCLKCCG